MDINGYDMDMNGYQWNINGYHDFTQHLSTFITSTGYEHRPQDAAQRPEIGDIFSETAAVQFRR